MNRGKRKPEERLPDGVRQDTRHRRKHCLRPASNLVETYLATPAAMKSKAWKAFEQADTALLDERFAEDPTPFDELAKLAQEKDVYIGCSCPTASNPDPSHCHTILALRFMKRSILASKFSSRTKLMGEGKSLEGNDTPSIIPNRPISLGIWGYPRCSTGGRACRQRLISGPRRAESRTWVWLEN